jgi:hypothetical protein
MPVSVKHSQLIYDSIKAIGIGLVSALPETWLVHLIRMAEEDPDMLQSGRRSMPSIEHWHFDTFHAVWRNREVAKAFVTFHLGTDGRPEELLVDFEGPITGVRTLVSTCPVHPAHSGASPRAACTFFCLKLCNLSHLPAG